MPVEKQVSADENSPVAPAAADRPASKEPGPVMLGVLSAVSIVSAIWNAATRGGHLEAFGRQGLDELGAALKAFPDTIQVQESGTIFNPTQGEIATGPQRRTGALLGAVLFRRQPAASLPSEIANENRNLPSKDNGNGHENDAGASM